MSALDWCPHMLARCPHCRAECHDPDSKDCLHIKTAKSGALNALSMLQAMRVEEQTAILPMDNIEHSIDQINKFLSDLAERGN
jgi:hypothetical protein